MEILFIIDSLDKLENKIALLDEFGANVKCFVKAKLVSKIISNKYIVDRVEGIYNNNVNEVIDKYIKSKKYKPVKTLLCYSSVNLDTKIINEIRENLKLNPDVIYIKKKFGLWDKFKMWFYQKIIKLIFGLNDEFASVKLQYFNENVMNAFVETGFKNHIFSVPNSLNIEIDKNDEKDYYVKPRFNKNYLYNPIVLCLILICYVVLERFLVLPFWSYLLTVTMILAVIVNWIVMVIKNNFDIRYKK